MALDTANPNFQPSAEWQRLQAEIARKQAEAAAESQAPAPKPAEGGFNHRQEREPGVCEGCGRNFQAIVIYLNNAEFARGKYCEPCVQGEKDRQAAVMQHEAAESKQHAWQLICPDDYRDTDLTRLRADMLRKKMTLQTATPKPISLDEIWRHDHRAGKGLGIIGVSGQRKTRIIFEYLRRLYFDHNITKITAINAVHFADDLAAAYEHGAGYAERFMERLEKARILLIDDLGKEKLTERVEATYYRIVEFRKGHKLPLFFTANMGGKQLSEKWQANAKAQGFFSDRAEPIVRRLREMTDSITVTDL